MGAINVDMKPGIWQAAVAEPSRIGEEQVDERATRGERDRES